MVLRTLQRLLKGRLLLTAALMPALLAASAAPVSASSATPPPRYIALGDSLAAGEQPDANGHDRPTNQGYVDWLGEKLQDQYPGLIAATLSCGGATTTTVLDGGARCQPSGQPGQLEQAETFLGKHPETVLVTIDVGDNDVEHCVGERRIRWRCVHRGLATIRQNLPQIAQRVKAAAGPDTTVAGVVDYDQFLSFWLDGRKGRRAARRSVHVIDRLNSTMASVYQAAGVQVADAGARFHTDDLTTRRRLPGYGRVPLDVFKICRWTWACTPTPGADDHANPTGYHEIGRSILATIPAPAGGTGGVPGPN